MLVEIEDSGTGIAPEVLKQIFEPFFTTKEVGKGTGLGLSMVYGIIKQTGGYIFCESEVGKGTVFRIFLPRHVPEARDAALEAAPRPEGAEGRAAQAPARTGAAPAGAPVKQPERRDLSGSACVLLVEDEDAVRMGGMRALTSRGYTVHEASSGIEALQVYEELKGRFLRRLIDLKGLDAGRGLVHGIAARGQRAHAPKRTASSSSTSRTLAEPERSRRRFPS